jgi:hypothetical protein
MNFLFFTKKIYISKPIMYYFPIKLSPKKWIFSFGLWAFHPSMSILCVNPSRLRLFVSSSSIHLGKVSETMFSNPKIPFHGLNFKRLKESIDCIRYAETTYWSFRPYSFLLSSPWYSASLGRMNFLARKGGDSIHRCGSLPNTKV